MLQNEREIEDEAWLGTDQKTQDLICISWHVPIACEDVLVVSRPRSQLARSSEDYKTKPTSAMALTMGLLSNTTLIPS